MVGYNVLNVLMAVDADHHLIVAHEVIIQGGDRRQAQGGAGGQTSPNGLYRPKPLRKASICRSNRERS